jgi:hypothetical protein
MKKNNNLLAFFWGLISSAFLLFKPKKTSDDMKKMEFSASAQKIGVRFTDKIRNIFRHRWVKKS